LTVTVVGYGRVGRALTLALYHAGARIANIAEQVDSERLRLAQDDGFTVLPLEMVRTDVDLLVLAVADSQIESAATIAARSLQQTQARNSRESGAVPDAEQSRPPVAMHLAGSMGLAPLEPLAQLGCPRLAWHPIQSFPADADARRFAGITVGITGDDAGVAMGKRLADLLQTNSLDIPEGERARYHLASVLASNFLPLLLDLGTERLAPFARTREEACKALLPLVQGMLNNLQNGNPAEAMTGPVARDDLDTVLAHLATFSRPEEEELYRTMITGLLTLAVQSGRMSDKRAQQWVESMTPHSGRN